MDPELVFFDTNILFYALDHSAGEKNERSSAWVRKAWRAEIVPLISAQVLQELFVNLARKLPAAGEAKSIVMDYLAWHVVENDRRLFIDALEVKERFQLSFWDASIVAAALKAKATLLMTEDLTHGQAFGPLKVMNPFQ
ncbi:MAG TPA: PIN domain-containing protein [Rectinemataceae bacterium]|nr:PIN domain-containing protein [Rectinemataceae bacterium]